MQLLELFAATAIKPTKTTSHWYEVEQVVGGRTIIFTAIREYDEENTWRVDFAEHDDEHPDEPIGKKTGKGKEFEVFSFVVSCVKDFVQRNDPMVMKLGSDKSEANRAPLYARIAKKLGDGYDITHTSDDWNDFTIMTKQT